MKGQVRKVVRGQLAAMSPAVAHAKSMAACKRLADLAEFRQANRMMIYLPITHELDVTPLALRGWQDDKIVCAPKISWDQRHMLPIEIRSLTSGLVAGRGEVLEPSDGDPVAVEMLDLVVVPALAYDRQGNRLGRGAGFYDRFLGSPEFKGTSVGIAFREQIVEDLPVQDNDVPVDVLVTDEEVLRFARHGSKG